MNFLEHVKKLITNVSFVLKVSESIFCGIVCILVVIDGRKKEVHNVHLYNTSIVTSAIYTLITAVLAVLYVFEKTHRVFELVVLMVGAVLNFLVGILDLLYNRNMKRVEGIVMSVILFWCGLLLTIDWMRAYLRKTENKDVDQQHNSNHQDQQ